MRSILIDLLRQQGIDPDYQVETDDGNRTAYEVLEAAVLGALEQIEEE